MGTLVLMYISYVCFSNIIPYVIALPSFCLTLSQMTNFRLPKLKEFADNNFKLDDSGRKFYKQVENTVGKGEIAHYEQFLLFPQCFSKDLCYRHVKTRACLEKC